MNKGFVSSVHADRRARKRMGLKDVSEVFQEALSNGTRAKDIKGTFKRYMDRQMMIHKSNFTIHKGMVYWFNKEEMLITVIPLHQKWFKYIRVKGEE